MFHHFKTDKITVICSRYRAISARILSAERQKLNRNPNWMLTSKDHIQRRVFAPATSNLSSRKIIQLRTELKEIHTISYFSFSVKGVYFYDGRLFKHAWLLSLLARKMFSDDRRSLFESISDVGMQKCRRCWIGHSFAIFSYCWSTLLHCIMNLGGRILKPHKWDPFKRCTFDWRYSPPISTYFF